ncbi:MAG: A24 family peptidase [Hyphomicrobium sp.]|nr:A24 family peptidase [Hyphomicrobium sp.]
MQHETAPGSDAHIATDAAKNVATDVAAGRSVAGSGYSAAILLGLIVLYAAIALPVLTGKPAPSGAFMAFGLLLATALVALSLVDIATYRLPDIVTFPLAALGIAIAHEMGWDIWWLRVAAAAAAFSAFVLIAWLYRQARGRQGLGHGDAKLMAAIGAWVGIEGLASVVLWSAASALVTIGMWRAAGGVVTKDMAIPFGPFLALGAWIVWLYGPVEL